MFGKNDEIATLNTLLATLTDSVNGFRDAADNSDDPRYRQIFQDWAQRRERAAEQLRSAVTALGGDARDSGSLAGNLHQRFLDLKAAITGRDDKAIINEVERGEDYLKEKFETALAETQLSPETRRVIEEVNQVVREGHAEMSRLKHSLGA